jgi:redox-sensitive bicupin YhaK (pirin superfamily)
VASTTKVVLRPSAERGGADHGWLNSKHTFSFAGYYDPRYESFGPLRVINEDYVSGGQGFGGHPHRDALIFSYPLTGALRHDDSLGHTERIGRGDIQFTAAGSGIMHSEYNWSDDEPVHFLQMWLTPAKRGEKPRYVTKSFKDEDKHNAMCLILSPEGKRGVVPIGRDDVRVYASILEDGKTLTHTFSGSTGYIHVPNVPGAQGITVNGVRLQRGDGAFLTGADTITITGHADADAARKTGHDLAVTRRIRGGFNYGTLPGTEFVLFDMGA